MRIIIGFVIVILSNWAMDTLDHGKPNPKWLYKFDEWLDKLWGGVDKPRILGIRVPKAFIDAWHFFKMFMIGGVLLMISYNIEQFIAWAVLWNMIWYFIYDKYHKVK